MPRAAATQAPLNALLKGARKNDRRPVPWTPQALHTFSECKQQIVDATLLAHPHPDEQLTLSTDANQPAVGAVLSQSPPPPAAPATPTISLLTVYLSVHHFRHMLEGRHFVVYTDHKPLTFAFKQKKDSSSPRQLRHLDFIGQFTTDIRYVRGEDNIPPDVLSRVDTISIPSTIDYRQVAASQKDDQTLRQLLTSNSSLQLREITIPNTNTTLFCDVSAPNPRPYIPSDFRRQVFDAFHGMAHPGINATVKLVRSKVVWPSMNKDCREWARGCVPCQRAKLHKHTAAPTSPFPVPDERFSHVHIDLVGRLPVSNGFSYCLTLIDRYTRWVEAIPLTDISATTVTHAFYTHWVSRFGVPLTVTTDQGRQFESHLFTAFTQLVGIKHVHTCAYHPEANGLIENAHRPLKAAIKALETEHWTEVLPSVLLALRTAFRSTLKASTAEMVYGTTLRLPGEFLLPAPIATTAPDFVQRLKSAMNEVLPTPTSSHGQRRTFLPRTLKTCTHVFVRHDGHWPPLRPPYDGPYQVLRKEDKYFEVSINGKPVVISVDRIKPAYLLTNDTPTARDPAALPTSPMTSPREPDLLMTTPEAAPPAAARGLLPPSPPQDSQQLTPPPEARSRAAARRTNSQPATSATQPPSPPVTRSGRRVHFPDRLQYRYH